MLYFSDNELVALADQLFTDIFEKNIKPTGILFQGDFPKIVKELSRYYGKSLKRSSRGRKRKDEISTTYKGLIYYNKHICIYI